MAAADELSLSLYTDGASRGNPGPAACAYILLDTRAMVIEEDAIPLGQKTNNEAEYQALIAGLTAAARHGGTQVAVFSDSELVMRQMTGRYRVSSPRLQPLCREASLLASRFRRVTYTSVPREHPMIVRADHLCNETLDANRGGR
ncbi:MAG TPA: ribonuclease HI family protein [Methanoregulaceae archaeon]|jgi:ribonuclease HI|nr:ribonuclease HI family protein [Methanoregulaceae archaeon]